MFPAETEPSPEPSNKRWSRKKIALVFSGLLMGCVVFLLAFDQKLEPYDDLLPPPLSEPAPTENGFQVLAEKWDGRTEKLSRNRVRFQEMMEGSQTWNESYVADLCEGTEELLPDLEAALALPAWTSRSNSKHTWLTSAALLLQLELTLALKKEDQARALSIVETSHRLARRQIRGGVDLFPLMYGNSLLAKAAENTCALLASGKTTPEEIETLRKLWKDDLLDDLQVRRTLLREAENFREIILFSKPLPSIFQSYPPPKNPALLRILVKKNTTLNAAHRMLRGIGNSPLLPVANVKDSLRERMFSQLPPKGTFLFWLNPNFYGSIHLQNHIFLYSMIADRTAPNILFLSRGMRLVLALHSWKAAHEGRLPAELEDLIPDYLEAIPADPWNGQPLGWDSATETVSAVGHDWVAKPPDFSAQSRRFVHSVTEAPALRLKLPPPPAPPARSLNSKRKNSTPVPGSNAPASNSPSAAGSSEGIPASPSVPPAPADGK